MAITGIFGSTTSSASPTFGGIASGLDTTSIVNSLIQAQSATINQMKSTQGGLITKQNLYGSLSAQLQAFGSAASALNSDTALNPIKASISDATVASISTVAGSTAGSYNLSVSKLAQAQKISSSAKTDTTSALGLPSGSFVINGHAVQVTASDSLKTIAQKINSTGSGATASLIDGGSGAAYLTLTASSTGLANQLQLADLSGSTLQSLGILNGTSSIRTPVTNGADSASFSSTSTTFQSLLNSSGVSAQSFSINGTTINVDLTTDTLQSVADKINSAGITGVNATVKSSTKNNVTSYALEVTGSTTPTFADANGFLGSIGLLQNGVANSLISAQDAQYTLDTVSLTSSTNTITTAIPGATLTLLAADATTPKTATISMTRDDSAITSKISALATAYNGVVDFIASNSQFDATTYQGGPLLGDSLAQQVETTMSTMMFQNVPGLTGAYKNLASVGFSLDQSGHLQVDNAALSAALTADPASLKNLFKSSGTSSSPSLSYVSSTANSKPTASAYTVNIAQLATTASFTAGKAQTAANPLPEKLTFNGALLGNKAYVLNLDVGSTANSMLAKINGDSTLKNLVYASFDSNGKLRIDSKKYGAGGNFTVVSDHSSASNNSGIGPGGEGVNVSGLDVQGTINGEPATGSGQFLTGATGNANTEGLQIQYTGATTGAVGSITYSQGISMVASGLASSFTDTVNGFLTIASKSLQTQVTQFDQDIATEQARLDQQKTDLTAKFATMETAVAQSQTQAKQLAAMNKQG